ncbi:flagellar hook-associated protein 3 [Pseudomonas sp. SWI6]|uniref:flagellar hook-associated protein 3 n=1 Tax=Pseudomonas TaxID=286 RepID=UPI0003C09BF4|nr:MULTISPECIES: flagellar hook-associated protein 3 [Pseudomonas]AGZ36249.1 flagellar hook-associated protein FlgL [Pseudomonas sp. VLB120]AVD82270.1 flagellar hook-associated protein 3 [Pseudomonas sp. SWI6]AVD89227.1 flagellar hook-associated protein 3 [Pseudomonas sp. SWI44]MBC3492879.1 flagellar hook-associated protein 3 [Pseudomonas taiwanensis]MDT8924407.1 flagellar hook-associated protein 3 [Pseudomonas taiwanensis]
MRISTAQFYQSSAANYQRNYANLIKTNEEASSFVRVNTAADDPVGAARLLQLGNQADMLAQYKTNATNITNSLNQAETTLNSINTILTRVNELALESGNAGYTDTERKAKAAELSQLEDQLLSLMNSRDENGQYLFAGSKTDTAPFVRNADGTYSYQGDQTQLELQVGDMLKMAGNSTGYSVFEQALNTSRTQTTMTNPVVDDGRVKLSNGQVSGSVTYNDRFRSGQPYTITMLSSTQYSITDSLGNDVTAEATQGGTFDPNTAGGSMISFRGVDLRLNINLQDGDVPDTAVAGHTFTLQSKPDTITATRSPGNSSSAQVSSVSVTDPAKYQAMFPSGGAVIKFTSATDFELYAQPLTADSRPVASGTMAGNVASAAGVDFTFTTTPPQQSGDQYMVNVDNHQTQNVLDTVAQLRTALSKPIDGDNAAYQQLRADLDSAIANIQSGQDQLNRSVTDIGARGKALEIQQNTNESLGIANTTTQSSIRDSDPATVLVRLTQQKTMLEASQAAFARISQLSLFNAIG